MKVYAVRKGRRTGIFSTWGECKKQVHKYHGAEFKSFPTEQEARAYLQASPSTKPKAAGKPKKKKSAKTADPLYRDYDLTFFVDGSFDQGSWTYSYGMVALNPEGEAVWEDGEAFGTGGLRPCGTWPGNWKVPLPPSGLPRAMALPVY